ncbi:TlpA disulfide reductase family protein [Thermotalea metallivorans]|uniref:Thiol-disulfide oxidoreductase ResA n=1 Tax=Thermotalea metallivorans TaxID=520762 RepID=A0A140L0T4_9FIRM|nr:TlpA disulfide reductase family protein [Thermotalea metallivorans]KXG74159.1 Thiol-disulfide oxidoreductase ResA [Thermotalea metallivorans]
MNRKNVFIIIGILLLGLIGSSLFFGWFTPKQEEEDKGKIVIEPPQGNGQESPKPQPGQDQGKSDDANKEENKGEGVFPGDKAYDFTLMDREGNEIDLSDLKGKVVFINFWTTWCKFCLAEMPQIQEVYEMYKDKNVALLAVNVLAAEKPGTQVGDVNQFIDERGYSFPVLYDVDGTVSVKYRVRAFPTTYILNKEGMIVEVVTGAMDKNTMIEKIENALNR